MPLYACQALLDFGALEHLLLRDSPAQLSHQGNMLGHIPAKLPELWVLLDKSFHVGNGLDGHVGLGLGLIFIYIQLDVGAQVAQVQVHGFLEEGVLVCGKYDFLFGREESGEIKVNIEFQK